LNRLTSETNWKKTVNYSYDLIWNITKITSPQSSPLQGEEVATKYNYDNNSRLINITKDNQNIIDYSYNSLNKIKETLWNWITTNFTFDELNRLSSLTTQNAKETINNYSYTYNTNWNIISNWVENYNYDNLNQIIEANYKTRERNKELIERFTIYSM